MMMIGNQKGPCQIPQENEYKMTRYTMYIRVQEEWHIGLNQREDRGRCVGPLLSFPINKCQLHGDLEGFVLELFT